ncbi:MAG: dockerin type I repeat-containing protein [Phycisphaerae bacterium]
MQPYVRQTYLFAAGVGFAAVASAQFVVFEGGAAVETAWRAAVGVPIPMEMFESYNAIPGPGGTSDQVPALPLLGINFATDVPGAYPGVYTNAVQAHSGTKQLANFGGGMGHADDYRILPLTGRAIYALGFWQCDPQGDQPMSAYDAAGNLLGTIIGRINNGTGDSFAGFTSTIPVARIEVPGELGDGWNHIDDLQVFTQPICGGSECPDVDCDGDVDLVDLATLLAHFGTPSGSDRSDGDFDEDGDVDLTDLATLLASFGTTCP